MAKNLRYMGLVILAGAAWMLIAVEAEWVPSGMPDMVIPILVGTGVVCIGAGMALALINPVGQKLRKGRCARCGAKIERGQSYCLDHLRETVSEYQDRARTAEQHRSGKLV